jgi:PadR family transcriptional regulator, regulatory protein PadR
MSGFLHPDQNVRNATQNSLCRAVNRRRGCCACRASNCRRRARFSRTRSSRERKALTNQPRKCRSENHIGKVRIELCPKSFILQVYEVLARYSPVRTVLSGRGSLPDLNVFIFLLLTEGSDCMLYSVTEDIKQMSKPADLVQGTLDMLLLKILALEPMNGFVVSQRLKQVSGDVLQVSDGSLYPALHKLEQEGWITAEWKTSEYGRRAKYYSLTRLGRRQLEKEADNWGRLSGAISRVIKLKEA